MPFDDAAQAKNWKTIVAVDLAMGIVVIVAGAAFGLGGAWWGWVLAAAGGVQLFFAGGRATKWARINRDGG